ALSGDDVGAPLTDILVRMGVAESKRRIRELLSSGAIQLNGARVGATDAVLSRDAILPGGFVVVKKGKKTFHIGVLEEK
ncbi:MAG TPA: S4 domain-containing protein, partial [Patescibacteria group bacterium]|nr:S4 domain-containing protein [Patescibacteria group bacterium]